MNAFWLGLLYTAFWIGVFAAIAGAFGLLYWAVKGRQRGFAPDPNLKLAPVHPLPTTQPASQRLPAPLPVAAVAPLAPPNLLRLTAAERRHTIVVGAEGDGKTQTQIAFLVGDINRGDQVVWASTNLALYHSRDQQTDLRPLAHLFEHTRDQYEIMAVLQWASAEVDRRMPLYHADKPHGHPIVIYVDELGGLYRSFGDKLVLAMRHIAEQGRKVDLFLFLVAHNTLKESTGLDAALKPLFKTRLLGNVDQTTWTALVGAGIKLRGVLDGQGMWHHPDKRGHAFEITIIRPKATEIDRLSTRLRSKFPSILAAAQPYYEQLTHKEVPAKPLLPAPVPTTPWQPSELHLQVQKLVQTALPDIIHMVTVDGLTLAKAQELTQTSNRALARRLGLGANGGSAAVRVGDVIRQWESEGGVRLFDIPDAVAAPRLMQVEQRMS